MEPFNTFFNLGDHFNFDVKFKANWNQLVNIFYKSMIWKIVKHSLDYFNVENEVNKPVKQRFEKCIFPFVKMGRGGLSPHFNLDQNRNETIQILTTWAHWTFLRTESQLIENPLQFGFRNAFTRGFLNPLSRTFKSSLCPLVTFFFHCEFRDN